MDFNYKKPSHYFALLLVAFTFLAFILIPLFSFFGVSLNNQPGQIGEISDSIGIFFGIIILIIQLVLVVTLFILVPILWYYLVNNYNFKQILSNLKLRINGIEEAVLWGFITMIFAFALIILVGTIMVYLGFNLQDTSNIPDLEMYFSLPSMLILISFQPIGEEIFFRGFLLDKINSKYGKNAAIFITALFFGIAHLSFGNIYPAFMTILIGILLAFLVFKTKNLYSAITAHILFNLISFSFYILGKSFQF